MIMAMIDYSNDALLVLTQLILIFKRNLLLNH